MAAINCANSVLEVGPKFLVGTYLGRKVVNTGWFDISHIEWSRGEDFDHLAEVPNKVMKFVTIIV